ncbi:helix-turn-helix transcriptional regulator [Nonomuraea sp. MCN248]|uniref:Helix-turn-helix transcriptional regulator n=1 Tax=Nonomuraea corallina TaxID=2989783 RepID=A0ABT4S4P9_9ACTN|nr:helix-turn-helix transcriptional regulator [Nonomuraea corallina]MDA0632177.1 helix-turn-helix transcriptional regulator [Nonomuraea corallina]
MSGSDVRGLLHPLLLLLICERPGHGYDLIERLARLGASDAEPGQVYRTLRSLERAGHLASAWVASEAGPARRRYELTTGGMAELQAWMRRLAEVRQLLETCLTRWTRISQEPGGHGPPAEEASAPREPFPAVREGSATEWEEASWAKTRH